MIPVQPKSIEDAVQILLDEVRKHPNQNDLQVFKENEDGFIGQLHMFLGMSLRNGWYLWWSKKGAAEYDGWPAEKPALIQAFNDIGIHHADDMSGIILTSLYRTYFNLELDLPGQASYYIDYWKKSGHDVSDNARLKKITYKSLAQ